VASLGNVGFNFPLARNALGAWYPFTLNKQPTSVTMADTSDTPYAFVALYRNAVVNFRSRADSNGDWAFYDMDDSGSQVYTIVAYTQEGPTGELWTATVDGTTVVVTKLFGSQRAVAAAFA
jgi:hypothetical protein